MRDVEQLAYILLTCWVEFFILLYGFLMLCGTLTVAIARRSLSLYYFLTCSFAHFFFVSRWKTWVLKIFNNGHFSRFYNSTFNTYSHRHIRMNVNWPPATSFLDTYTRQNGEKKEKKTTSCSVCSSLLSRKEIWPQHKIARWFIAQLKHLNRHFYNFPKIEKQKNGQQIFLSFYSPIEDSILVYMCARQVRNNCHGKYFFESTERLCVCALTKALSASVDGLLRVLFVTFFSLSFSLCFGFLRKIDI